MNSSKPDSSIPPPRESEPAAANADAPPLSFTGRDRVRTTRPSVKIINVFMKYLICTGGISVVLVFAGIMLFICLVVYPLFKSAQLASVHAVTLNAGTQAPAPAAPQARPPLAIGLDADLTSLWKLSADGQLTSYCLSTGGEVFSEQISAQPITAFATAADNLAIGTADGAVRFGTVKTSIEYLAPKDAPPGLAVPPTGELAAWDGAVVEMTAGKQIRVVRLRADLGDPTPVGETPAAPILAIDYERETEHENLAVLRADGRIFLETVSKRTNMMTGQVRKIIKHHELPAFPLTPGEPPPQLLLGQNSLNLFLIRADGQCLRYNTTDPEQPFVAEEIDLTPEPGVTISAARWLNGRLTIIVADSQGGISGWFAAPRLESDQSGKDRLHTVQAHVLETRFAPATALAPSVRDRQFVSIDPSGGMLLQHMTSGSTQGHLQLPLQGQSALIALAPENNAIAVLEGHTGLHLARMKNPHADGSLSAMFSRIWYEGYPEPGYVYQSSAGTDDAEPKFSMMPLIYGTLKATLYAMLFSVPIAVLAAIFTSEFMHPKTRNKVKPVIEVMASLPSVVLGFIAAQVLAPIVGGNLVGVGLMVGMIPLGLFTVGYIWQLLPGTIMRRALPWQRFLLMFLVVMVMGWLAWVLGPVLESILFSGNAKTWLAGSAGSSTPGWVVLLTPLCFLSLTLFYNFRIRPALTIYRQPTSDLKFGSFEITRGVGLILASIGLAILLGLLLNTAGLDFRGTLTSSYVERNSLVLGIIMGFAIIPIIYTISEDALSAVPNTLRSASLGMGATPWQTAVRVVLPVAFPGVFSACMIGFGRAAGETMIVLMASGRTPVMDLSPFNGLSALSANIATELPEAPRDTTHYRMLFMSAVILFIITFVVNTAAEIVRLRYRKRSAQL